MESEYVGKRRTEQQYLRQYLLPGVKGECLLCGRTFSRDFLVAAHIKKRSLCTLEEKADIKSIAMLACKFGCDELFERGMIGVTPEGKVTDTKRLTDETARTYMMQHLVGRSVNNWSSLSASHQYFQHHLTSSTV
jgi:predicted restriction endonuclease